MLSAGRANIMKATIEITQEQLQSLLALRFIATCYYSSDNEFINAKIEKASDVIADIDNQFYK